jgi:hypothetical protein
VSPVKIQESRFGGAKSDNLVVSPRFATSRPGVIADLAPLRTFSRY